MSYPIYILDLEDGGPTILFPEGKVDLDHSVFWEQKVAAIVAKHYRLPVKDLKNLPYCFRRARISGDIVYYGEKFTKSLLKQIEKAVGEKGLRFVYDEHEQRLSYDVDDFNALVLNSC